MTTIQALWSSYWGWFLITIIALVILFVLLWRNFDIEEITPTPPFIKLKRKSKPAQNANPATINVTGNKLWGKNKISVRRENSSVVKNTMVGENELEIGAKPGRQPKGGKSKK